MSKKDQQQINLAKEISRLIQSGETAKAIELLHRFDKKITDSSLLLAAGKSYYFKGDYKKAITYLKRAYQNNPNCPDTRQMLWSAYRDSRQHYKAMLHLTTEISKNIQSTSELLMVYRTYLGLCDWHKARQYQKQLIESGKRGEISPDMLPALLIETCALPDINQSDIRDLHCQFGDALIKSRKHHMPSSYPAEKNLTGRMKIAYLSADFNFHPVGCFINHIITNHLHNQFEIYCYAHLAKEDEITEHIRNHVDHFIDITTLSDADLAVRIHADGIHIAIDLGGLTTNTRIAALAHRPAPVQITYLGYPNTSGLSTVDYRITDIHADKNNDNYYVEKLLRMPQCFICYGFETTKLCSDIAPSEKKGYVTFGSFNHVRKLNPEVIKTWCEILNRVPGSRFILKAKDLDEILIRKNIIREFELHGVSEDRLQVQGFTESYEDNFKMYNEVDIALDTFPYNGTTTTCDALSVGVPVLTLVGKCHAQRVSYSILKNIGFEDTITTSCEAYVEKAVQLSQSPESLSVLRRCLVTLFKHSVLRQPMLFTRQLEALLSTAWTDKTGLPLPAALHPKVENAQENAIAKQLPHLPENHLPYQGGNMDHDLKQEGLSDIGEIKCAIPGDIDVVVPDNINEITSYVLTEQGDWFEYEMPFIRKLVHSGDYIIDIGANYGCYALTMAKLARNEGRIWAFEPGPLANKCIKKSIECNQLNNIKLIAGAVSDHRGVAHLVLNSSAELNYISHKKHEDQKTVEVPLYTLDESMVQFSWTNIDFIKIDAEGEEIPIIEGGVHFFSELSPLVMFEYKGRDSGNVALIHKFREIGYGIYFLIPKLDLLVPLLDVRDIDEKTLNLFCCKADRAMTLEREGFLIREEMRDELQLEGENRWINWFKQKRYAEKLLPEWSEKPYDLPGAEAYISGLSTYAAIDQIDNQMKRYQLLKASFILISQAIEKEVTGPRLLSMAHIARDMGLLATAVLMWQRFLEYSGKSNPSNSFDEPFLANDDDFIEKVDSGIWPLANAINQHLKFLALSSAFLGPETLPELLSLKNLGYWDKQLDYKERLIRRRSEANLTNQNNSKRRNRFSTISNMKTNQRRQLHIGGQLPHPDWEIIDALVRDEVDHIGNASNLSRFSDNTFDALYSSHVLEHFGYQQELPKVLNEWLRVLKPGGKIYVSVPNLKVLCELFLAKDIGPEERYMVMRMMFGGQIDAYDFHKVGYDVDILAYFLTQAGFENIRAVKSFELFNDTSNMEFAGKHISLNLIAEKPLTDISLP